ncbi:LPXTG cell wall anchor domain-containing protein [Stackebrandtia soli]|uniref:LPXTG cell wall anchor domain-containing protein n=1 Tax=Stackebrandtia soli TaxID=1892856 RepID=UPI0039E9B8BF
MSVLRTLGRVAVSATAVAVSMAVAAPATAANPTAGPGAATWLASQSTDGGFGDAGLTADAIYGFVSADVASGATAAALDWLDDPELMTSYVGDEASGFRAPQLGKILLAVEAGGRDGTDFAGLDLESALRGLEDADGVFSGGYSSPLGQAFAILALSQTSGGASANAVAALAAAQCDNGAFGWSLSGGVCDGDVDYTGYAVAALLAAGESTASSAGLDWLESQQHENGSFVAGFTGAPENSNSTAMAGQALASGGRDAAAAKAVTFLESLQIQCDATADVGAVPYAVDNPGVMTMATAQSIPAMTGEGLAELTSADDTADLPVLDCDGDTGPSEPSTSPVVDGTKTLPKTGATLTFPLVVGAIAVVLGAVLFGLSRRRSA